MPECAPSIGQPARWGARRHGHSLCARAVSTCLNSPILGTVLWGPQLIMLYNDAYIPSMADRHPNALGRPVAEVWDTAWEQVAPDFHRCMATGEGFSQRDIVLPMVRRGQPETTYWDFSAAPIRGEDGSIVGLFNQGMETTDRTRAEAKRDEYEAELQALNLTLERRVAERTRDRNDLWELSSDIMLRCDFTGMVVATNPAWREVLGWSEAELSGRSIFTLIHPDDEEQTRRGAQLSAEGHSYARFDNRYLHKDGSYRWISWSSRPSSGVINAVGRDFTVERERLEALKVAEASLRQSQKMEAVGQLTGGLAHDFNNLLAGISGSLEMLRVRFNQGRTADLEKYLGIAQDAAKRAAALTHRLLAFSRRQTLDPRPIDVDRLVEDMEELIRRSIGPRIELRTAHDSGLWPVLVDPPQLENALLNLCLNSRDAMPNGGRVTIDGANQSLGAVEASSLGLLEGDYVLLRVIDTGAGMTPAVIARVFEPFFTTKPLGSGTGLGLSMVYGFVQQSGGQVGITSEVAHGTTVSLYLPRYTGSRTLTESVPGASAAHTLGQGKTVLVVDDEPSVRMLVADILSDLGYVAVEAADSVSGLRLLQSDVRIELVITDVGLPGGMNGRQMIDAARMFRPGLKVLFITGYAEGTVVAEDGLPAGMQLLTKPFLIEDMIARIGELVEPQAEQSLRERDH